MKRLTVENTKKAVSRVTAPIKEIEKKINPLEQKVDTHNTSDTGIESIKLVNQSVKTTKSTVKTTRNTIKATKSTVKTTAKITKNAAKVTVKTTVKVVTTTAKIVAKVATEIVAALSNPYVLIIALVVLLITLIVYGFVTLIGGGDTSQNSLTQAVGLCNVEEQYENGKEFYNTALINRQSEILDLVNGLYYDINNLRESDLLYYKRFEPTQIIYEKDYPSDTRKENIAETLEHQFDESQVVDFIAIAYVYLEKKENEEKNTYMNIYEVEFTQEVFDELIEICIPFSDKVNQNQECPSVDCTRDKEAYKEWQKSDKLLDKCIDGYNEWVSEIQPYIDENGYDEEWAEWRVYGNWYSVYGEIFPEEPTCDSSDTAEEYRKYCGDVYNELVQQTDELLAIYQNSTACDHEHVLHSIGISFYDSKKLMEALDFNASEKQWVEVTAYGFERIGVANEN